MSGVNDMLRDPLGGLSRTQWLARLEDIAEDEGAFEPIGERHSSVFIDRSPSVLLVTFEEADHVRLANRNGHPIGFQLVRYAQKLVTAVIRRQFEVA